MKICALILAAGASSRLGRPKQLLKANGKTLLEKAVEAALEAPVHGVYVILGARSEEISTSIADLPVQLIRNEQWQEGIGSSISKGIQTIRALQHYDAVLIMLCDQLHITAAHLTALISMYRQHSHKAIVATAYDGQSAVPAVFDQHYFLLLEQLSGDTGAKKIIGQQGKHVRSIRFEKAMVDIDTPEDQANAELE